MLKAIDEIYIQIPIGGDDNARISKEVRGFQKYNGYLLVSIKNVGDRPTDHVAVQWQAEGLAEIREQDGDVIPMPFKDRLEVGRLAPERSVSVLLWTTTKFDPETSVAVISHDLGSQPVIKRPNPWMNIFAMVGGVVVAACATSALPWLLQRTKEFKS